MSAWCVPDEPSVHPKHAMHPKYAMHPKHGQFSSASGAGLTLLGGAISGGELLLATGGGYTIGGYTRGGYISSGYTSGAILESALPVGAHPPL